MAPGEKVTVSIEIKTVITVSDTGYLGTEASIEDHIDKARADLERWTWYVHRGQPGIEPEQLRVRAKVLGVTYIPKDEFEE